MANVHTHTQMKYQWANPWQTHSPPLSYTLGSQITLYKGPVQVILWFHKQSERRWTRKQSQHITFFTRPQTQVRKLCDVWNVYLPQLHLRGTWHNWLTQSVYLRAFISVCLLFWKLTPGDPQSLHVCTGKVTESLCVSTRSCEPLYNRSSMQYTHTVKIKVLPSSWCYEHEPPQEEMMWRLNSGKRSGWEGPQTLKLWPGDRKSNDSITSVTPLASKMT